MDYFYQIKKINILIIDRLKWQNENINYKLMKVFNNWWRNNYSRKKEGSFVSDVMSPLKRKEKKRKENVQTKQGEAFATSHARMLFAGCFGRHLDFESKHKNK